MATSTLAAPDPALNGPLDRSTPGDRRAAELEAAHRAERELAAAVSSGLFLTGRRHLPRERKREMPIVDEPHLPAPDSHSRVPVRLSDQPFRELHGPAGTDMKPPRVTRRPNTLDSDIAFSCEWWPPD
jgi:hypothetical protein